MSSSELDDAWNRPPASLRPVYEPTFLQERYMVPLLARWIEANLEATALSPRVIARVLDVGCGSQPFRPLLERLGYQYAGLDVQASEGVQLDFVAAIDRPLPPALLALPPFELVVCFEVLEHVADWTAAFANLARLVTPGGWLVLTCPHVYQLHDEPFDFWRPTPHTIRHYAEGCGFEVKQLDLLGNPWEVLGTTLASSTPVITSASLPARARRVAFRAARRCVLSLIDRGRLQSVMPLNGPVYLSNAAVLVRAKERA